MDSFNIAHTSPELPRLMLPFLKRFMANNKKTQKATSLLMPVAFSSLLAESTQKPAASLCIFPD